MVFSFIAPKKDKGTKTPKKTQFWSCNLHLTENTAGGKGTRGGWAAMTWIRVEKNHGDRLRGTLRIGWLGAPSKWP